MALLEQAPSQVVLDVEGDARSASEACEKPDRPVEVGRPVQAERLPHVVLVGLERPDFVLGIGPGGRAREEPAADVAEGGQALRGVARGGRSGDGCTRLVPQETGPHRGGESPGSSMIR